MITREMVMRHRKHQKERQASSRRGRINSTPMTAAALKAAVTATAPAGPLLGMYETNGNFPGAPSTWPSGPTTNMTANYFAMYSGFESDLASFITQCDSNSITAFCEMEPWYQSGSTVIPILFSDITSGAYDAALEAVGTAVAGSSRPVMLTFAHEFNIGGTPPQYPWAQTSTGSGPGGGTLTAAEWKAGWAYVKAKVNSTANGNALWVWAPGAYTGGTTYDPTPYWPTGADAPDIVGVDGYPSTTWGQALGTFAGQIQPTVTIIRNLGWNGVIFISETNLAQMVATGGETITSFVTDMYTANVTGILEFEDITWDMPQMSEEQWSEYNTAIAATFGSGGSGGGGGGGGGSAGAYTYTQTLIDSFPGSSLNLSTWAEPVNTNGIQVSGGALLIKGLTDYEQVVVEDSFNHNLADGIFGLQLTQSGAGVAGTMWFLGICDNFVSDGGNAYEFQTFPARGQWYSWAFDGTNVSGDAGDQDILSPSVWNNGDWLGIGNYNIDGANDVHVYKSPDGETWTEIASFTVTGDINEAATGFYFGTNYDSGTTGTSTYLATIHNVSWFTRGTSSGGGGGGSSTPVVQVKSGETSGTSLTLTFDAPLTAGNKLVIATTGYYGGALEHFIMDDLDITFLKCADSGDATAEHNAQIWSCDDPPIGATQVTVTSSVGGLACWAYEVNGQVVTADLAIGAQGSGASWSSGATGTTIPYPHVIVGVAARYSLTGGTITGPAAGGWTNETPYNNLASGTMHFSAVSGYQEAEGSGSYTYSGSQSNSSAWGAACVAFLANPSGGFDPGWGGYVFTEHAGVGYTGISATWTVPPLTGGAANSVWVGIGEVYQCGMYHVYDTSFPEDTSCWLWTEMLPGGGYEWSPVSFPVSAGDSLTCSMRLTETDWYLTITNNTKGWSYTDVKSVLSINIGSIHNNGAGPGQWPYPVGQAEVIIEDEGHADCANYGALTFTEITTVPAATQQPVICFTGNKEIPQYPGPYSADSNGVGTFTMHWHSYN